MLELSVLMENHAAKGFACEHGLSFLLESDDTVILFDTGATEAFLGNAARMGRDLGNVTHIVLSHGHADHTGGLGAALRHIRKQKGGGAPLPPLIAHPGVQAYRKRSAGHPEPKSLGMPDDARNELAGWPARFSADPVWITESIVFLGEIPRVHPEMCTLVGDVELDGKREKDLLPDDTAIAYVTGGGLVIIAGCSHSGIGNNMEQAKPVTGVSTNPSVYGGLLSKDMSPRNIEKTRAALAAENLEKLFACHCTGDALADFPGMVDLAAGKRHTVF